MSHRLQSGEEQPKRRYIWPWFVLGAVLLGILLAILWLSREIARTERIKELNAPAPDTNQPGKPHAKNAKAAKDSEEFQVIE